MFNSFLKRKRQRSYAHTQVLDGCPWSKKVCEFAAVCGHLDCLRYAHENGCPWNEDTCDRAALNGHLDCLTLS